MRSHDNHDPRLMDALEQLEQHSPLRQEAASEEQNQRICRLALEQIGTEAEHTAKTAIPFPEQEARRPAGRRIRRPLRVAAVAAALLCFGSISVYAVGAKLLPMLSEKIGFFDSAPSRQQAGDAADAPRGEHGSHQLLEVFNTAVGTSVESSGITLTLDNVSMDVSGLDAFFTAEPSAQVVDQLLAENDYMPLWDVLGTGSFFQATLNGTPLGGGPSASDWYRTEDGKLKFMVHFTLPQLPQGEQLDLKLQSSYLMDQSGEWTLRVALDGASVRAGGKVGTPVQQALPADTSGAENGLPAVSKDLDLVYLAFGPRGGVMMTRNRYWKETFEGSDVPMYSGYTGSPPDDFMVTDSTGKTLYVTSNGSNSFTWQENDDADYFITDLTLPDPAATSVTLTPMIWEPGSQMKVTTQQLKEGLEIPCGPESGYRIKNFVQENSSLCWELEPYGYGPRNLELIPEDDGLITMTNGHSGLLSQVVDPRTGIYSCRLDYYAATPEEVASITDWIIPVPSYRPDHQHAVTVPLSDVPAEG